MPRIKPTEVADVIGNLDILPEEAIGDYIESKQTTNKEFKEPNWDSAGDSESLMFLHARAEHNAMLKMQKTMLKNNARNEEMSRGRIATMNKMQEDLRHRFIKVNNFFKECEEKKRSAEQIIDSEIKQHKQLQVNIEFAKDSIVTLGQLREDMKATLAQYQNYERITAEAVQISPIYESIKDCMGRADALMIAHDEIHRTKEVTLEQIDKKRRIMVTITQDAALAILGMQNSLLELERSYKTAMSNCQNWEKYLTNAKNAYEDHHLEKWRTHEGIFSIFSILWNRTVDADKFRLLGVPAVYDTPAFKLNFVSEEALFLQALIHEIESDGVVTQSDRQQHLC